MPIIDSEIFMSRAGVLALGQHFMATNPDSEKTGTVWFQNNCWHWSASLYGSAPTKEAARDAAINALQR